ncbi:MAG: FkbM family methyltransferase [Gammaproteobacteria bacterium]|nr:FkbM family methyltransferase [Gammaproteobacteria bacterium]
MQDSNRSTAGSDGDAVVAFNYRGRDFKIFGAGSNDHVFKLIAKVRGFYEIDLLEYMLHIRDFIGGDGTVSVDIGANIGNHSLFFASFLTSHVISIEPNPVVLPLLKANLQASALNATVRAVALGDSPGRSGIVMPDTAVNNLGMARLRQSEDSVPGGDIEVTTLDLLLDDFRREVGKTSRVSLIKIDVEGMELQVLRGAVRLLASDRPHVFVEAATRGHFQVLRKFLLELDYVPVTRWATTPVYHFAYQPSLRLKWRARTLKLLSEMRRPVELRRLGRTLLLAVRAAAMHR